MHKAQSYWQLMRCHKPIGTLLLFFPVCWALLLAYDNHPPLSMIFIFTAGVLLTRAAGCIINDICDRGIDRQVDRTQSRPLANGTLSVCESFIALFILSLGLMGLWVCLKPLAQQLGLLAAGLTLIYPFTKRFFHFPQLILGVTFNMGVLMVFAQAGEISETAWWLYAASVVWTFSYDTVYALADQSDDQRLGVHSSALSLGSWVTQTVCAGYLCTFLLLGMAFERSLLIGLCCALIFFVGYMAIFKRMIIHSPLAFFNNNAWMGLMITILVWLMKA